MPDSILPRPLYLMIKPPADALAAIEALARSDYRAPSLKHATLLPVGESRTMPNRLEEVLVALDSFEADAARAVFDFIHDSGSTVALRGSETMRGLCRLQEALREHLRDRGVPLAYYAFNPHITLSYFSDGCGSAAIDPISWRIEEILLIESVHGEARHIEHGRWRLRVPAAV